MPARSRSDALSGYPLSHRRAAHARRHRRGARRLRRRERRAQSGLHHQRKDLIVPLRQLFLVSDPGDQAAVDPDIGELAELVDDLLRGSYQGVAAVTGYEMRLVSVERLGVQRLIVQPEDPQEIAGSLPVALLVDVVVEIILGLLLALPADDVDVDPNPRFAPMRARHLLEMIDLGLCAFGMGAVLEDDEIHVAVARGEFLRRGRSAGVHDRRMGLLQRLGLAPDRGGIEALATEIELLVLRPRAAHEIEPFGGVFVAIVVRAHVWAPNMSNSFLNHPHTT